MNLINNLLQEPSSVQAIVVIFLIMAMGHALGKLKIKGVSLGVTFVFFCGIIAGHFGLTGNPVMLSFAQDFGLIIFVYALGLQVGPGFFNSFRRGGLKLNMLSLLVVFLGTAMAVIFSYVTPVSIQDMVGVLSGAVTNTPALAAAQQTLHQMGLPEHSPALATAVTYPLGVVGVIMALIFLRSLFSRYPGSSDSNNQDQDSTFVGTFDVVNPAIFGQTVKDISSSSPERFVISRVWRDNTVLIPSSETVIEEGDRLLVITNRASESLLQKIFGKEERKDMNGEEIDWNKLDDMLVSHSMIVSRPEINGKTIGALRLRNRYGVNISRVIRSGMRFLATPDLVLQLGDRVIVVGEEKSMPEVEKEIGNVLKHLYEPNLVSMCIGIILGLVLGAIPIAVPGISAPVRLGLAGGPIISGILMGALGPRIHVKTYTTESANLMLRRLGLSIYLVCLGLSAGGQFFETVFRPEGLLWIGLGFSITVIPVVLVGVLSFKAFRLDYGAVSGMLCGAMANPMALNYASSSDYGDRPALSYTSVYPLAMAVRVILAQLLLVIFL
ncbi:AspT/YidE/YbjL antiporter duplication domain-containing protein [Bacteroidales bacterium WCE2008]|nr:AspT/YidE/YbjL antiporter duplication domain-containing protein [Bacteroidales bacterium WCE2008]